MSHIRVDEHRIYRANGIALPCDLCGSDTLKTDAVEIAKLQAFRGELSLMKQPDDLTVDWVCRSCVGNYIEGMFVQLELIERRQKDDGS